MNTMQQKVKQQAQTIIEMMVEYIRSRYEYPEFDVKVKLDYHPNRKWNHGGYRERYGKSFINIYLKDFPSIAVRGALVAIYEYPHIADDPEIGSLENIDWVTALAAIIAHELAHAAQYNPMLNANREIEVNGAGRYPGDEALTASHGKFWQSVYRALRVNFVN